MGYILHGHVFLMHHEPDRERKKKSTRALLFHFNGWPTFILMTSSVFISFVEEIPVSKRNLRPRCETAFCVVQSLAILFAFVSKTGHQICMSEPLLIKGAI